MKNLFQISLCIAVSIFLLAGCSNGKWITYTNNEYGFKVNYPRDLSRNEVKITQKGNEFSIEGLNGFNSEFRIPFTIQPNIHTQGDLEEFIKKKYGKTCKLGEMQKDPDGLDIYSVSIITNSVEEGCWINWITFLKYSPKKQKAVAIDVGQELLMFEFVNNRVVDYTMETIESFQFTH